MKSASVIIVNYRADALVAQLQKSLKNFDCVVVDNSSGERGFGGGCNLGAKKAKGEILVFLNPDIQISPESIEVLARYLREHPDCGLVGPQIRDEKNQVQITCSAVPNAWQALLVYSFLGKLPGFSWIHAWYRLNGFSHASTSEVPSISGSCFALRKIDFDALGGFDEHLFLYFEEFDLSLRIRKILKKRVVFCAEATAIHKGQHSTNQVDTKRLRSIFRASRRYWLTKYYGWSGSLVSWLLSTLESFA